MPALVVRELTTWLADRGGYLAAGGTPPGLDRSVEGVARLRRAIHRELEAFEIHDVIVASTDTFQANTDISLDTLIEEIADTQAALIVAGLPNRSDAHDSHPYQLADRLAIPLLSLPATIDLADLTHNIIDLIHHQQVQMARHVRSANAALGRARHSADPLHSLAAALASFTGLTFVLEDEHRHTILRALPENAAYTENDVIAALASYAARQSVRPATPGALGEDIPIQRHLPGKLARAIVPLRVSGATVAYLSLLGPEDRLTPRDIDVLWQASSSFAFEIGKRRKETTDARQSAADDLARVLNGTLPEAEATRRAGERGYDLADPHAIAVVLPRTEGTDISQWARNHQHDLSSTMWAMAHEDGLRIVLGNRESRDGDGSDLLSRLGGRDAVVIGIGRAVPQASGLRQSLREAQIAAQAGLRLTQGGITRFSDLGIMRLLYPLHESGTLTAFSQDMLAPICNADAHQGDALLTTLDAWFTVNGNMTEAARRLNLHRNTLMYRLNRIEDALGTTLDDPDTRLSLQVALKIWRMLPQ
jgi:PucR family transcriptional regulator, purine catabolism regulatory protein